MQQILIKEKKALALLIKNNHIVNRTLTT